ncbi:MATE family efflux transporter [Fusibacter paucivorans]|uniref:Multidrug export protein MepA n=1 Tax=Fusibacter paucivorans TaxID=76009 RepID=A0ABS5PSB4_9FIRM|nr:MATE family efflux transporter [Fusibacter paucivorans]MBS7527966.1 MATE family efflux transporter [Fusibacter paucivorans]
MEQTSKKQMILEGNMWQVMWRLSWPAVLAMVLYGMNTVFDALFVGRFVGETALAGISLAYPLTQIALGFGSLIGVGAGSALSIAIGAGDHDTQKKVLGNVNYLNVVIGLVFSVIGYAFAGVLVRMMGGSGDALAFGVSYFRVTQIGAIFWIAGLAGNMVVRAEGKMKSAAVMMASGLIVNVIINYILIVLMDMGVVGAAIGTNIGMVVYTLSAFIYFKSGRASFDAKVFSFRRDQKITKDILSMGMPSFIMTVMTLIQAVVVMNALTKFGTTADVAFYGIVYRLFTFMLTPIFGLMRALQPAIGINFGARQYERVISAFKVFAVAATALMLPFWLVGMTMPEFVLNLMLPAKAFTAWDLGNFRIFMALLPIMPVIFMAMTFFPAINNSKPATMMGIARQLVFYVPVMLILPRFYGVRWVYLGSCLIDTTMTLWVVYLVTKEFGRLRRGKVTAAVNNVKA